MRLCFAMGFAAWCAVAGSITSAQSAEPADSVPGYPARPIRMIVPFPPGGSNDIMGRYFGNYLTERLGRQVVMDNRAGADGIIGTEIVARSQPDGYTLLVASAAHAVNGGTRKLPVRSARLVRVDRHAGIGPECAVSTCWCAREFGPRIDRARQSQPGKLVLSTSGGYAQFSAELFHHMSGMKLIVVVYKGGFPALLDAMAGQAQINIGSLIQTLPHMNGGKIRALATTGSRRSAAAADLPTIAEAGVPGYEANNWWAVGAPAGTSPRHHHQAQPGNCALLEAAGNDEALRGGRCRSGRAYARGSAQFAAGRDGEVGECGQGREYSERTVSRADSRRHRYVPEFPAVARPGFRRLWIGAPCVSDRRPRRVGIGGLRASNRHRTADRRQPGQLLRWRPRRSIETLSMLPQYAPAGTITVDQMYVRYQIPVKPRRRRSP